ncbi:hypothetical protein FM112_00825 [Gulosibacter sp. 10]|nr:hypothetical protein FM112_00825 [Gulosibacter sp. 10]
MELGVFEKHSLEKHSLEKHSLEKHSPQETHPSRTSAFAEQRAAPHRHLHHLVRQSAFRRKLIGRDAHPMRLPECGFQ